MVIVFCLKNKIVLAQPSNHSIHEPPIFLLPTVTMSMTWHQFLFSIRGNTRNSTTFSQMLPSLRCCPVVWTTATILILMEHCHYNLQTMYIRGTLTVTWKIYQQCQQRLTHWHVTVVMHACCLLGSLFGFQLNWIPAHSSLLNWWSSSRFSNLIWKKGRELDWTGDRDAQGGGAHKWNCQQDEGDELWSEAPRNEATNHNTTPTTHTSCQSKLKSNTSISH